MPKSLARRSMATQIASTGNIVSARCLSSLMSNIRVLDDPETFKNAPISIQVVARTLEEEALVGISEIVDRALQVDQPKL